jgi:chemotaxis protein CheD
MRESMVRMGEYASSATAGDVLVARGLGSCVGLVLLDRGAAVAGLAHVVLPAAEGRNGTPGRYADTAVSALLDALVGLGARPARVEAVLVGGASMFAVGTGGLEIGQRNEEALRAELARRRITVAAAATGGDKGRTVRVDVANGRVTSKAAGETALELVGA